MKARQFSEIQRGSGHFRPLVRSAPTPRPGRPAPPTAPPAAPGSPRLRPRPSRITAASWGLPSIQIRLAARTVAQWWPSGSVAVGHLAQRRLGLLAAPKQHQVHRPYPGRSGSAGLRGGGGESVGQIEIQQRHGMPRRFQVQRRVGVEIRLQAQQRPAHGGLHVGVAVFAQPRRQPAPDFRQIELASARAAQLTEERVREPRRQSGAGAFDAHQAHSLRGRQVATSRQIAQHVDGQRFALRQRVDDDRQTAGSADPSGGPTCRTGSPRPRRRRPTSIPRPISRIRPAATWSASSWRRNKAFPPVSFRNRAAQRASIGPSSLLSMTSRVAAAESGSRSRRSNSPSFHNAVTASGSSRRCGS